MKYHFDFIINFITNTINTYGSMCTCPCTANSNLQACLAPSVPKIQCLTFMMLSIVFGWITLSSGELSARILVPLFILINWLLRYISLCGRSSLRITLLSHHDVVGPKIMVDGTILFFLHQNYFYVCFSTIIYLHNVMLYLLCM